jgi:succinate dehydrogenase / fumarate reductase flavoprotein subunit
MHARHEMLDLVVIDGRARGIIARDLVSGRIEAFAGDAVVLATGGYGPVYYLSTNARGCNVTATYRAYKRGAYFANPCFTQIHPTCIPVSGEHQSKLTLMSESLRNDGRIWVPLRPGDHRPTDQIPEAERDYYLERKYPSFGNLAPRDVSSRAAKEVCDEGRGVGPGGRGVYLDFSDAIRRLGESVIRDRYGNLFDMYHHITDEDPYRVPMRIYPAIHYCMGGLWVDYQLMSNVPGLFVLGEANYSDHGANRLGASALMQGLADGYFIVPYTMGNYLAANSAQLKPVATDYPEFKRCANEVHERVKRLLAVKGKHSAETYWRRLGKLMWDYAGMARSAESLKKALAEIPAVREEFWQGVCIPGGETDMNLALEQAGRIADFLEFAELLAHDALDRDESCGAHFRIEHQYPDGEAKRDDEHYCHVSAWEHKGVGERPALHKEPLAWETVVPSVRSYK